MSDFCVFKGKKGGIFVIFEVFFRLFRTIPVQRSRRGYFWMQTAAAAHLFRTIPVQFSTHKTLIRI